MTPAGLDQILSFFFRPQGRISRLEFGLGTLVILFLDLAILAFLGTHPLLSPGVVLAIVALGLPLTVAEFVLVAKRCHDLNLPGSFVLLLVVPAFNAVWLLMLAVLPGNPAPNAYGPPPRFRPD
jgi:uncharacterized membrane protein YhaH (DUF805 family)